MRDQLEQMKSGSTQTATLILETHSLAESTKTLAEAAKTQADNSSTIATGTTTVANATQRQATISASSAKSTEIAIHLTESADIILDRIVCSTPGTELGLDTQFSAIWRNAGRGGASKVETIFYIGLYASQVTAPTETPSESYIGAATTLQSSKSPRIGTSLGNSDEVRMANLRRVNDGTLPFHAWGWVTYQDRFRGKHLLVFDTTYVPKSNCEFRSEKIVGISR